MIIGPNGDVHASGSKGVAVNGPGGEAIAGAHGAYGAGFAGTQFVAASDLRGQGVYMRNNFRYYNAFTPNWFAFHPRAWFAAGWIAGLAWTAATWGYCAASCGYPVDTAVVYYNYGENVTYQEHAVYYADQRFATQEEYAQQAAEIAAEGQEAKPADDEQWQPLGVFAMVKGDETTSNDIFQPELNLDGVVRGNYHNAVTDSTTPVVGSLEKNSQRVAWTIEGSEDTVYETGLYNVTLEETTILVHFGKDGAAHTEQYKLFRVRQADQDSTTATQE